MPVTDDNEIKVLLSSARTIAVIGASEKPWRDSNDIMRYLIEKGYRVFGVNPAYATVLDRPCYPSLKHVPEPIDIVDVFRRSDAVLEIAKEAISVKAKTLWLQLGVINQEGSQLAEKHDMKVIINRCIAVEHRRLIR